MWVVAVDICVRNEDRMFKILICVIIATTNPLYVSKADFCEKIFSEMKLVKSLQDPFNS